MTHSIEVRRGTITLSRREIVADKPVAVLRVRETQHPISSGAQDRILAKAMKQLLREHGMSVHEFVGSGR